METAILATLWNGPATMTEVAASVYERLRRRVSPGLVDAHLRMLECFGFVARSEASAAYTITERGSLYLANTAAC